MEINQQSLTFFLALASAVGVVLTVYRSFRDPQIKADGDTSKLRSDLTELGKVVSEIKETHLRSVEKDIKELTTAVNDLSKTVVRLSTIIDERIPKASPNLTPPGS